MLAPAGASMRLKVRVLAGRSASVAVAVKLSVLPSSVVRAPMAARTGARLTSFTVTVIVSSANRLGLPSSVTRTLKVKEPGPSASDGVQLKAPLVGWIVAPDGAPIRLYVNVCTGESLSTADA